MVSLLSEESGERGEKGGRKGGRDGERERDRATKAGRDGKMAWAKKKKTEG